MGVLLSFGSIFPILHATKSRKLGEEEDTYSGDSQPIRWYCISFHFPFFLHLFIRQLNHRHCKWICVLRHKKCPFRKKNEEEILDVSGDFFNVQHSYSLTTLQLQSQLGRTFFKKFSLNIFWVELLGLLLLSFCSLKGNIFLGM